MNYNHPLTVSLGAHNSLPAEDQELPHARYKTVLLRISPACSRFVAVFFGVIFVHFLKQI